MINLLRYLHNNVSRSFKWIFTVLFIVINVFIVLANTVYINTTMDDQNTSLVDMVHHLSRYTDQATVVTYLEHYGHTHDVRLDYQSEDGHYSHITQNPPQDGETFTINVEGEEATLVVANAQSNLFMTNLAYLLTINAALVMLYVGFLIVFHRRMREQNNKIIDDVTQLQTNIGNIEFSGVYTFEEFSRIESAFEKTINNLERLKARHKKQIQSLAHDIKTPLTIINGMSEGIVEGRLEPTEEMKQSLKEEIDQISSLIETIIEDPSQTPFETMNLSDVLRKAIERNRVVFEQKGVALYYDIAHDVSVVGNPDDLRRVMDHLLQNSLTHTPRGKSVYVTLTTSYMRIIDEGEGMDASTLDAVFDKQTSQSGSGIGLQIVKAITDVHHFTVTIDSKKNQGTSVTLNFDS